jgi:hypothetical protein
LNGSWVNGVFGNQQVGAVYDGADESACLWNGTRESWVSLHPAGASGSQAAATSGAQQFGTVSWYTGSGPDPELIQHAALWSGSAESWVDLHPGGAKNSAGYAISGGRQVGIVDGQASVWSGTPESRVSLAPRGASWSAGWGAFGDYQVGVVVMGEAHYASFWHGTSESWVNLGEFLPAGFTQSYAYGVWSDGEMIYVAGYAHNAIADRSEALLWVGRTGDGLNSDLDNDGCVGQSDLGILLAAYEDSDAGDVDGDGQTNQVDLGILLGDYGQGC